MKRIALLLAFFICGAGVPFWALVIMSAYRNHLSLRQLIFGLP